MQRASVSRIQPRGARSIGEFIGMLCRIKLALASSLLPSAHALSVMGGKRAAAPAGANAPRKLLRQTTEQRAERALKDNVPTWGPEETHVKKNAAGNTMFEQVCIDIRRRKGPEDFKLGAKRWQELKDMYRPPKVASATLEWPAQVEEVPAQLLRATIAAKRAHPDREPLQVFLSSCSLPNKTSMIGMMGLVRKMNPRAAKQLPCCLDWCRFVLRCDIKTHYPTVLEEMRAFHDVTLCAAFERGRLAPLEFMELHQDLCKLVLPEAAMAAVVASQADWGAVSQHLNKLVASSQLGLALFSFAVVDTLATRLSAKITEQLAALDTGALKWEVVNMLRAKMVQAAEAMENVALMPSRRVVEVVYRGKKFTAKVSSISQQVSLCVAAKWKTVAVQEGSLKQLWTEEMLFGAESIKPASTMRVGADMICAASAALTECNKHFTEDEGSSGSSCLNAMRPKFGQCFAIDGEFAVEVMLIECLCGEGSGKRISEQILAALPSKDHLVDAEQCTQALTALSQSPLFRLANKSAQAKVAVVLQWLRKVMDAKAPDFSDASKDDDYRRIVNAFQYFCRHEAAGDSKGAVKVTLGLPALQLHLASAKAKAGNEGCKLNDIAPVKTFAYLLQGDAKVDAEKFVASVEATTVTKAAASSSGAKAKKGKDAAVAEAMALFTNPAAK